MCMFGITLGILAHLVETVSKREFVVFLSIKMCHCFGGFGISELQLILWMGETCSRVLGIRVKRCWQIIAFIQRNAETERRQEAREHRADSLSSAFGHLSFSSALIAHSMLCAWESPCSLQPTPLPYWALSRSSQFWFTATSSWIRSQLSLGRIIS